MIVYILKKDKDILCASNLVVDISNYIHNETTREDNLSIEIWRNGKLDKVLKGNLHDMISMDIIQANNRNYEFPVVLESLKAVRKYSDYEAVEIKKRIFDYCIKYDIKEIWSDNDKLFDYYWKIGNIVILSDNENIPIDELKDIIAPDISNISKATLDIQSFRYCDKISMGSILYKQFKMAYSMEYGFNNYK